MSELSDANLKIKQLADRCVMCGLCSTQCPTYQLHRDENESPRGRISILKALASGEILAEPSNLKHIESCLQCRNCERLCPSGVAYGELLDLAKSTLPMHTTNGNLPFKPGSKKLGFVRFLQKSGAIKLTKLSGLDRALNKERELQLLPDIPKAKKWSSYYPAHIESQGQVALFTGCATNGLENSILDAGIRLLNRYGYSVFIPPEQNCCGAIDLHSGNYKKAVKLAKNNIQVFNSLKIRAILYTATGCGASLSEYEKLVSPQIEANQMTRFKGKPKELTAYILELHKSKPLPYKRLQKKVAVYTPCSSRNVLRDTDSVTQMLSNIPGLEIHHMPDQPACCGAAGTHMLTHPEQADALGEQVLAQLLEAKVEMLVTNNIGCKIHLASLIKQKGLDIPIVHPIALINQQLA